MKLYLYGWISTLIAFALCFPSDGSLSVSSLQARAYLPLVERTNPNVPRAGVSVFYTTSGLMRIWVSLDTVLTHYGAFDLTTTTFDANAVGRNIRQHFVQWITANTNTAHNQDQAYFVLASSAGTVVRTIFDTNGQWDGALAIDVSAAAMYNLYGARNFLVDYWVPFTYAVESYFTADPGVQFYMVEIAESALGALGGASANIPLISLRKRTDIISEQVCAKPVDLRSYLRNTIPNVSLISPVQVGC